MARRSRDGEGFFRNEPSQSPTATASPKGTPLAKRAGLVLIRQRQEEASVKLQTLRLCQSLSLSGEVARRSRDGEGFFRNEPSQSPTATARSPFCRLPATSSPGRGKSFEGRALGKEGRSRPHSSTAGRSQPLSCKLSASAKASPFRERWHGEAVTERVAFRDKPSQSRCARLLTSPPCPAMMVSYQTVDGLNSWPAKQMGEKQDEREIQKKL